jgi:aminoglycoside 2'-N-acetyltransferase I
VSLEDPATDGWTLQVAHTSQVDTLVLAAARALLDEAFDGDFSDHDWEHCLGGIHALTWDDGELVGHAAVVQRRLVHGGRALRTGYVEGVAVRADRRGRGHGRQLMTPLQDVIRLSYELGALSATEEAPVFYEHLGWELWRGPTSALTPAGIVPTPDDDGSVYVLRIPGGPVPDPDLDGALACDWRDGDVW